MTRSESDPVTLLYQIQVTCDPAWITRVYGVTDPRVLVGDRVMDSVRMTEGVLSAAIVEVRAAVALKGADE